MRMRRSWSRWNAIAGSLLALLIVARADMASARHGKDTGTLTSGTSTTANGRLVLALQNTSDGRFMIKARGLERDATYEIVVDNTKVGTLRTSGGGNGRARFRTRPRSSNDQLLGFDPRGVPIAVRNAAGEDVLVGQVASAPSNDSDVICCIPDDDGDECEDRTPAECAAAGGTVSTATSCLPNPCAGATPNSDDADIICCLPDDSGSECEDRTQAECLSQGGVVVQATSCTPNPCAAIPPVDDDIQCCLPDNAGFECEDRTEAECAAQGGISMGAGTCTPDPCTDLGAAPSATPTTTSCYYCNATAGDDNGGGSNKGGGSNSKGKHGGDDTGSYY